MEIAVRNFPETEPEGISNFMANAEEAAMKALRATEPVEKKGKVNVSTEIHRLVFKNQEISPNIIQTILFEQGIKVSVPSAAEHKAYFLRTLAFLKEAGAFAQPAPEVEVKGKKKRKLSRADRWATAASKAQEGLAELVELQEDYQSWYDNLPDGLRYSGTGEKLAAICGLDLEGAASTVEEAEGADLPMGFGRD